MNKNKIRSYFTPYRPNLSRGYLKMGDVRGVDVLWHWSCPVVVLSICLIGHAHVAEWLLYCAAYFGLILLHESGHVLVARRLGLEIFSVRIFITGGICRVETPETARDTMFVYSGGFLAQGIVFLLAQCCARSFGVTDGFWGILYVTFTYLNGLLLIMNLAPWRGVGPGIASDGAMLWDAFRHVLKERSHTRQRSTLPPDGAVPRTAPRAGPATPAAALPDGGAHFVEIVSGKPTSIEFLVVALTRYFGLTREQAIVKMVEIRSTGSLLLACESREAAARIAASMTAEARAVGYRTICRYAGN